MWSFIKSIFKGKREADEEGSGCEYVGCQQEEEGCGEREVCAIERECGCQ